MANEIYTERCPKCRHPWRSHETTGWPTDDLPNPLDECGVNMGMGDWCACKEKRPEGWNPVEDFIAQFEGGVQLVKDGRIIGYEILLRDWQSLVATLRWELKNRG